MLSQGPLLPVTHFKSHCNFAGLSVQIIINFMGNVYAYVYRKQPSMQQLLPPGVFSFTAKFRSSFTWMIKILNLAFSLPSLWSGEWKECMFASSFYVSTYMVEGNFYGILVLVGQEREAGIAQSPLFTFFTGQSSFNFTWSLFSSGHCFASR